MEGHYRLSEGSTVATKVGGNMTAAICDGQFTGDGDGAGAAAAAPMVAGKHDIKFEVAKNDTTNGSWCFGVCRPEIDLNDGERFPTRDDTWMMYQSNAPYWEVTCNTCEGTGLTIPERKLNAGDRVGLLLDLANGGTLTMYLDGKPCGTIAEGLEGPLYPCIESTFEGKVVQIHSGLAPP